MGFITTILKLATGAMVTGMWTGVNHYAREQMNSNAAHLVREVERGVKHQAVKLELIKKN